MNELMAVLIGFAARLGIPVLLTVMLVMLLKRLDQHWRAEATEEGESMAANPGCWEMRACPQEVRGNCKAYAHPEKPCWQVFRQPDGRLQERCLLCDVFRSAPVPAMS